MRVQLVKGGTAPRKGTPGLQEKGSCWVVVPDTFNHRTLEAEVGGSLSSRQTVLAAEEKKKNKEKKKKKKGSSNPYKT